MSQSLPPKSKKTIQWHRYNLMGQPEIVNPLMPPDCAPDISHTLLKAANHNFCWKCGRVLDGTEFPRTHEGLLLGGIISAITDLESIVLNPVLGSKSRRKLYATLRSLKTTKTHAAGFRK